MNSKAPKQTTKPIEITLPSGIFATIRPGRFLDTVAARFQSESCDPVLVEEIVGSNNPEEMKEARGQLYVAALMAQLCRFDDQKWTLREVLQMDARDSGALINAMGPFLTGPVR
jgi:hypothetical protein